MPAPQRRTTFREAVVVDMPPGYKPSLQKARNTYREAYGRSGRTRPNETARFVWVREGAVLMTSDDIAGRERCSTTRPGGGGYTLSGTSGGQSQPRIFIDLGVQTAEPAPAKLSDRSPSLRCLSSKCCLGAFLQM